MCAPLLHLPARDLGGLFPLLLGHHVLEQARADDVGALADDQRPVALLGLHQFDAGVVGAVRDCSGTARGRLPSAICAMARMCAAVVPQQPPTMLSQPLIDEALELRRQRVGRLQVLALLVRQPGVGIAGDARRGDISLRVRMWSVMNSGPVRAVEADREQVGVGDGRAKRVGGLAGEHGAHGLDGAGDHRGNRVVHARVPSRCDGQQPGLDVARILAGFEQQDVGAAFDQRLSPARSSCRSAAGK